jgi:hypothetical protein
MKFPRLLEDLASITLLCVCVCVCVWEVESDFINGYGTMGRIFIHYVEQILEDCVQFQPHTKWGKAEIISSKIRNQARVSTLLTLIQHSIEFSSQINKKGERREKERERERTWFMIVLVGLSEETMRGGRWAENL